MNCIVEIDQIINDDDDEEKTLGFEKVLTEYNTHAQQCFPELVIVKLISFFTLEQKKMARLINNIWRYEAERYLCFKVTLSNMNIEFFINSEQQFEQVKVIDLTKKSSCLSLSILVKPIHFPIICSMFIIGSNNSDEWISYLLKYSSEKLQNLEFQLSLEHLSHGHCKYIRNEIDFKELTKLSLYMCLDMNKDFEAVVEFLKEVNFPKLKDVQIELTCPRSNKDCQLINLTFQFYLFLIHHNSTLDSLHCTFQTNLTMSRYPTPFTNLETNINNTESKLTNLKNLYFLTRRLEMNDFAMAIMNDTNKLEKFVFCQQMNPYTSNMSLLGNVLQKNSSTLEFINIEFSTFDTIWLKPCINLKELHLCYEERIECSSSSSLYYDKFNLENLYHLHIELFDFCVDNIYNLVVNHMTNLSSITIGPGDRTGNSAMCKKLGDILQKKSTKLENIYLQISRIDLTWFKSCYTLKYLQLGSLSVFVNLFKSHISDDYYLPNLKSFKIYDNGFTENFAIRLLGLQKHLVEIIKNRSWECAPRMLHINKIKSSELIEITISSYGNDRTDPPIETNIFQCQKLLLGGCGIAGGIESITDYYQILEVERRFS